MQDKMSFVLTYELKQETPIIHFQHNQSGATLRATEVKPKLDRFIIKKLGGVKNISKDWFVKETEALNYKMQISALGEPVAVELGMKTPYDIFYGNMRNSPNQKKGIVCDSKLNIVCTIVELREFIDKIISEFFVVTNFGTMQNKGFGSYTVKNRTLKPWDIPQYLKEHYGAEKCYSFSGGTEPFVRIKTIYSMMKSGVNFRGYQRSYLFLYMHGHKYKICNEKAALKQKKLVPIIGKNKDKSDVNKDGHTHRYVRALLGVCDHLEFINDIENKKDKTTVKVSSCDNEAIARLQSPIFFKVINGNVYFVAGRINQKIYGAEFDFSTPRGNVKLRVPDKTELGDAFIDKFLAYSVNELNESGLSKFEVTKNVKIQEV